MTMDKYTGHSQLVDYLGEYLIEPTERRDSDYHFG
jgi:hypothetical protein